jgi:hypothetical protein
MKITVKPRWVPLLGWATLFLVALACGLVLYFQPSGFLLGRATAPAAANAKDSVDQALKDLSALQASGWLQMPGSGAATSTGDFQAIAPAPDAAPAQADAGPGGPVDPALKGAVVVRQGKRQYLVLGSKRFQVGQRIGTGEVIKSLSLQSVVLATPEGRARTVEIGRNISPPSEQAIW